MAPSLVTATATMRLRIDWAALAANWQTLRDLCGAEVTTAAVVKADGYGLGLERAGRELAAAGCRVFFVATTDEGVTLRGVLPEAEIYILDGFVPGAGAALAANDLKPVLGSLPEIDAWKTLDRRSSGAALHVDTGMNRLGLAPGEASSFADDGDARTGLGIDLLMSHLACADTPNHPANRDQLVLFRALRARFPALRASLANSAGIFLGEDYRFDLVRPGIALYGAAYGTGDDARLATVVTAEARILQIRSVPAGGPVGYGATEIVKRPSRIAILGAGYADGYHRRAGSTDDRPGAAVFLHGVRAPLVGRVSMDLTAVDVTDIADAAPGDWVELFGPNIPIDEVAGHAETIGYELLTGLGRRALRLDVTGD